MIELNRKMHPSIGMARGLTAIRTTYGAFPEAWNPSGHGLLRLRIDQPILDTKRGAAEVRAFIRFTKFDIAGAYDMHTRLFVAPYDAMRISADSLEHNYISGPTLRYVANCVGFEETARISTFVGMPEKKNEPLSIQYHLIKDGDAWIGITKMLKDLGATKIGTWTAFNTGPGYGYATLDHHHAPRIAAHPLVRNIGLVGKIAPR